MILFPFESIEICTAIFFKELFGKRLRSITLIVPSTQHGGDVSIDRDDELQTGQVTFHSREMSCKGGRLWSARESDEFYALTDGVSFIVDIVEFRAPFNEHLQTSQTTVKSGGEGRCPSVVVLMMDVLDVSVIDEEIRGSVSRKVLLLHLVAAYEPRRNYHGHRPCEGMFDCVDHVYSNWHCCWSKPRKSVLISLSISSSWSHLNTGIMSSDGSDMGWCPSFVRLSIHVSCLPEKPMHTLIAKRNANRRSADKDSIRTSKLPAWAAQCNGVNLSSLSRSTSLTLAPRPTIPSSSLTLFARTISWIVFAVEEVQLNDERYDDNGTHLFDLYLESFHAWSTFLCSTVKFLFCSTTTIQFCCYGSAFLLMTKRE